MSKNIFVKLIICIIFTIILLNLFCISSSYALGDIVSDGKAFLQEGEPIINTINTSKLIDTSNYIYNMLLTIAIFIAVAVAIILGIQFMVASADEKAKVKEALLPFVVGCFVVFGSFTIWKIVVEIGNDTEKNATVRGLFDYCFNCGERSDGTSIECSCGASLKVISYQTIVDGKDYNFCYKCGNSKDIYRSENHWWCVNCNIIITYDDQGYYPMYDIDRCQESCKNYIRTYENLSNVPDEIVYDWYFYCYNRKAGDTYFYNIVRGEVDKRGWSTGDHGASR